MKNTGGKILLLYYIMKSAIIIFIGLILIPFDLGGQDLSTIKTFEKSKEALVMRMIAHEVLLASKDSTSRVLPIKLLSENKYQLQFESNFTFEPDSLVSIIQRNVIKNQLSEDYIVNVVECQSNEVIFGYAILGTNQDEIVPCIGRDQMEKCYLINIEFANTSLLGFSKTTVGLICSFVLLSIFLYRRNAESLSTPEIVKTKTIGQFQFSTSDQFLIINDQKTTLTNKESKLLEIFAKKPNELVSRDQLQKEVWEDEGVIVGRSLDMFISKLRKKLNQDPNLKIVNVHGKGYILEMA